MKLNNEVSISLPICGKNKLRLICPFILALPDYEVSIVDQQPLNFLPRQDTMEPVLIFQSIFLVVCFLQQRKLIHKLQQKSGGAISLCIKTI